MFHLFYDRFPECHPLSPIVTFALNIDRGAKMNAHNHPLRTAADVLAPLDATDLPPLRRRDMTSAIKRVCEMAGCSPNSLKLDIPELRARLAGIRPAAHGISAKTF